MNRTIIALSLAASMAVAGAANAQTISFNPSTGDVVIDQHLGYQDRIERDVFLDRLVDEFGGDRNYYLSLLDGRVMSQAELYYACSVGAVNSLSCATVVDQRQDLRARGQGWGVLAQRYGIEPGSPQFHALKDRMGQAHGRHHAEHAAMGSEGRPQGYRDEAMERRDYNRERAQERKDMRKTHNKMKKEKKNKSRGD